MLVASATACDRGIEVESRPPGPFVLIVIDTLRADHLSCYGYEYATSAEICRIAKAGVTFERAYTPKTQTTPAIASILTGLPPHPSHRPYRTFLFVTSQL